MISHNFYWKLLRIHLTFDPLLITRATMAYMNNVDYRSVSNSRASSRVKQILVLITTVLIGMLVSVFVNF